MGTDTIRWFSHIGLDDVALVGGKTAALGEMFGALSDRGVRLPNGFAVTAAAYRAALDAAGAWEGLHRALDGLDKSDAAALRRAGRTCRRLVYQAGLTPQTEAALRDAWRKLVAAEGRGFSAAIRSSATAEDLPGASFAGQHETFLNIASEDAAVEAVKRCNASLFTDRAISYRIDNGFDHVSVALSACVMRMVRADLGASGVMFTVDTESGHPDMIFITAGYGLGETIVQGTIDPDEFLVHKPTFRKGFRAVLGRALGRKQRRMVYAEGGNKTTSTLRTTAEEQARFCITDAEVLELAGHALAIEEHFSKVRGHPVPMDIEWARDGIDDRLYILQARPETVTVKRAAHVLEDYAVRPGGTVLATGRAVGHSVSTGKARVVRDAGALGQVQPGEVLVADTTSPDWEPVMKTASAIVTNRGGRTCHAAIVARELGVPAVVGAAGATAAIATGETVTVSCAEGAEGRVYRGAVPFSVERVDTSALPPPPVDVMVNLGEPDLALQVSALPVAGVGLARLEFIIGERVKAHPMALAHPERLPDDRARKALAALATGSESPADFFVERVSEGVGLIAAAFWPRPVIARLSDFKANEYAKLLGGDVFEEPEANPMIGFRGASRYAHPAYEDGFALECAALRRVRDTMGLTNLRLMVPFCRRIDEADRVLDAMARHGLRRGENGLEIWMMVEIPSNVILIEDFAARFDGFSIGSNDLTQLVLGVDRDSALVAFDFDERDPAVMAMLRMAVEGARRAGRPVGICGQAPSDYPEVARFLVDCGIGSISLTPDTVLRTLRALAGADTAARAPSRGASAEGGSLDRSSPPRRAG